jgi:hypothetical protein
MLAATIGIGEQSVLAIEGYGTDGALDHVGIDVDAPVIEEACKALPAREGVTDRLGDRGFLRDRGELPLKSGLEAVDDRSGPLASRGATHGNIAPADLRFDGIELGDALECLGGGGRGAGRGELTGAPPHMAPAGGQFDLARFGEGAVTGIAVDLQDAAEALEMGGRALGPSDPRGSSRRWPPCSVKPWRQHAQSISRAFPGRHPRRRAERHELR